MDHPQSGISFLLSQASPPPDDIYDIVVLEPKETLTGVLFWIFLFLLILAAIGLALWFRYRRHWRRGSGNGPEKRIAEQIRTLRVEQEHLEPNRFALRLSDALKDYLSAKFDEPVRFETTQEFLGRVSREGSALPEAARESLAGFLVSSDEIKFANLSDADIRSEPLLDQAVEIVKQCRVTEPSS